MYRYFSQKQLLGRENSRLVIIEFAGYLFRQLFLRRLYVVLQKLKQFIIAPAQIGGGAA